MVTTNKVQVGEAATSTSTSTTTSQWQTYNHYKAEQGWECPRCGRINAPWVRQCDCSRDTWTITTDWTYPGKGSHDDWWKTYVTCGQADDVTKNPNVYQVGGSDYWDNNTHTWTNVAKSQTNSVKEANI